jgi:hypothetical protein
MFVIEASSRVRVDKHFSDTFSIRNVLKKGEVLSPFLFYFPFEYTIRRVQVKQNGLKLNGTHWLLVYADDLIILGGSIRTMKNKTEAILSSCWEREWTRNESL